MQFNGTKRVSLITSLYWKYHFKLCMAVNIETRDALLFSQLQAGLELTLIERSSVSKPLSYNQLYVSAKLEEIWQKELSVCDSSKTDRLEHRTSGKFLVTALPKSQLILPMPDPYVSVICLVKMIISLNNVKYIWKGESTAVEPRPPKRYLLLLQHLQLLK